LLNHKFVFKDISFERSIFYKGIAILMIIMHNFFHWLPPLIGENEQGLNIERVKIYFQVITNQPELFIQSTLAFLGHYGVQVFLFLSAYGLSKKYANSKISYGLFLKKRILKIYPVFIFSILAWVVYTGMFHDGPIALIVDNWKEIFFKLTFISNFIPGQLYTLNGPWWFVSLIIQFYIVFPFIIYLYKKYHNLALISISIGGLVLAILLRPMVDIQLGGTILLHLPELSLGIFLAKEKEFTLNYCSILFIILIFILSNLYTPLWYLSFSSAIVLLLMIFQSIVLKSNKIFKKSIIFIGSISMYIFYINGFMRTPWITFAKNSDTWYMNIFLCFLFIITVVVASLLMKISYGLIEYEK